MEQVVKIIVYAFIIAAIVSFCCFSIGLIGKLAAYVEMQIAIGVPWYDILMSCGAPGFVISLFLSISAWLIYDSYN